MKEAFQVVDEVLLRGVQGISDIITVPGLINVDFADVKAVMQSSGSALMGIGRGTGEGRAMEAAKLAINSPLLETSINGASGIIMNVTGGSDMTLHEVTEAAQVIHDAVAEDAIVTFGSVIDDRIQGEIQITVIATGFEMKNTDAFGVKDQPKALSAADFFSGSFNAAQPQAAQPKPAIAPAQKAPAQDLMSIIDIPPFLQK